MIYPFPKPAKGKKKKPLNNKKPTAEDICTFPRCNRPYAHNHEIYYGRGKRQLSIKYKLQKRLCYEHHNMPGGNNPHFNKQIDKQLKQMAQKQFEEEYSHDLFMKLFNQNYL
ncbi:MAG TPA: hypothetical protein VMV86_04745 [Methanosarcinales archaeon]|nr:hypothetical protein [Methanosarcinales archaeon]